MQAMLHGAEGAQATAPALFSCALASAAVLCHASPRYSATTLQAALQGAEGQLEAERQQARERAARQQRLQRQEGEWKRLEEQVGDLTPRMSYVLDPGSAVGPKAGSGRGTLQAAALLGLKHHRRQCEWRAGALTDSRHLTPLIFKNSTLQTAGHTWLLSPWYTYLCLLQIAEQAATNTALQHVQTFQSSHSANKGWVQEDQVAAPSAEGTAPQHHSTT